VKKLGQDTRAVAGGVGGAVGLFILGLVLVPWFRRRRERAMLVQPLQRFPSEHSLGSMERRAAHNGDQRSWASVVEYSPQNVERGSRQNVNRHSQGEDQYSQSSDQYSQGVDQYSAADYSLLGSPRRPEPLVLRSSIVGDSSTWDS
jgi:hypothetical protein